jgi:hypothetical protein
LDVKTCLHRMIILQIGLIFTGLTMINPMHAADSEKNAHPGSLPPEHIQNQVRPLLNEVRNAQLDRDLPLVQNNIVKITKALGDWAGNPETAPNYFSPIESMPPLKSRVGELWRKIDDDIHANAMWRNVPDGDPKKMKQGLRAAGRTVITYSILYSLNSYKQQKHLNIVTKGANYLLDLQQDNGLFPLPDLRGKDKRQTVAISRVLRKNPAAYKDGWILKDHRGELLYDHAVAAVGMIEAFRITLDRRYYMCAEKASKWAMQQAIDTNWSNNAFAAWLLAEFYSISEKEVYLNAAIEKLKYGVLPGLMKNGRWIDPINSKLVHHAINVRGLLAVLRQLPEEHSFKERLENHTKNALDNAAAQINSKGASSVSTSTEMLIDAITEFGIDNKSWLHALYININASLKQLDNVKVADVGVYLPKFIQFVQKQKYLENHEVIKSWEKSQ